MQLTTEPAKERIAIEPSDEADCSSFEQFVREHETAVFTFCFRMLGDTAVAEYAASAAFQAVYLHFPAVSLLDVLAAARRCCQMQWRSGLVNMADTAVTDIQHLFNQLTLPEREVMALRYGCKLNFDEMALVLNTSCEALRDTLRRGRWRIARLEPVLLADQN
ncbi:MAG: hypothetical protein KJ069_06750 [Anaerolineae bacterium]|nr:hypothetical protein [Anaerolineae bacterium]